MPELASRFREQRVQLASNLGARVWVSGDSEVSICCLFGAIEPSVYLELAKESVDFYVNSRRRLIDQRFADIGKVDPALSDTIAFHRGRMKERSELDVLLIQPGLQYALARTFQSYSELRGKKVEVAVTVEECSELLGLDLDWYRRLELAENWGADPEADYRRCLPRSSSRS